MFASYGNDCLNELISPTQFQVPGVQNTVISVPVTLAPHLICRRNSISGNYFWTGFPGHRLLPSQGNALFRDVWPVPKLQASLCLAGLHQGCSQVPSAIKLRYRCRKHSNRIEILQSLEKTRSFVRKYMTIPHGSAMKNFSVVMAMLHTDSSKILM